MFSSDSVYADLFLDFSFRMSRTPFGTSALVVFLLFAFPTMASETVSGGSDCHCTGPLLHRDRRRDKA